MELENKTDYDKLEIEIMSNENLRESYTVKKAAKQKPKIVLYDVSEELDETDIINRLVSQNELPEDSEFKVEFTMKGKRGRNVVISSKPEAFN